MLLVFDIVYYTVHKYYRFIAERDCVGFYGAFRHCAFVTALATEDVYYVHYYKLLPIVMSLLLIYRIVHTPCLFSISK